MYTGCWILEGVAFPDSKQQKQLHAKIDELRKLIIDTDNESVHRFFL